MLYFSRNYRFGGHEIIQELIPCSDCSDAISKRQKYELSEIMRVIMILCIFVVEMIIAFWCFIARRKIDTVHIDRLRIISLIYESNVLLHITDPMYIFNYIVYYYLNT